MLIAFFLKESQLFLRMNFTRFLNQNGTPSASSVTGCGATCASFLLSASSWTFVSILPANSGRRDGWTLIVGFLMHDKIQQIQYACNLSSTQIASRVFENSTDAVHIVLATRHALFLRNITSINAIFLCIYTYIFQVFFDVGYYNTNGSIESTSVDSINKLATCRYHGLTKYSFTGGSAET